MDLTSKWALQCDLKLVNFGLLQACKGDAFQGHRFMTERALPLVLENFTLGINQKHLTVSRLILVTPLTTYQILQGFKDNNCQQFKLYP